MNVAIEWNKMQDRTQTSKDGNWLIVKARVYMQRFAMQRGREYVVFNTNDYGVNKVFRLHNWAKNWCEKQDKMEAVG